MRQVIKSSNGKIWGIIEDGVYRTYRKRSKHYVRKYLGWGIQAEIIYQLERLGVKTIEIIDVETKTTYSSSLDDWLVFGQIDTLNPRDGAQLFLSTNFFKKEKINNRKLDDYASGGY